MITIWQILYKQINHFPLTRYFEKSRFCERDFSSINIDHIKFLPEINFYLQIINKQINRN